MLPRITAERLAVKEPGNAIWVGMLETTALRVGGVLLFVGRDPTFHTFISTAA
jgi:hypothetical protein